MFQNYSAFQQESDRIQDAYKIANFTSVEALRQDQDRSSSTRLDPVLHDLNEVIEDLRYTNISHHTASLSADDLLALERRLESIRDDLYSRL